jgi:hypothetical protein
MRSARFAVSTSTVNAIAAYTLSPWHILLLAIVLLGASFAVQGRQGISLADEGFLWYGAQQTAHGKVPLRDFQSYDPGRYYWSAAGMYLFGDGLVALRFSETVFQLLGLWAGLLAASRVVQNWALLAAVGLMLTLWMFQPYRFFDNTLVLCGIWIAVRLIEGPSSARIFTAGFFVGLCVFFGKNHALYNFLAQASLLLFLHFKVGPLLPISHLGMWVAGIMAGLVPTIAMFVAVPGFFASYIESIQSIFRHRTNLALPIPWPWRVSPNSVAGTTQFLLGIFLIALPLGYLAAITVSLSMRSQMIKDHAVFVACAFVGLFYLHHAFSRADFGHLTPVIHPFTLGALALLGFLEARKFYHWAVIAVLIAAALFTVGRRMAIYQRITSSTPWVPCDAGGKIFVPTGTNRLFTCLRKFAAENIAPREGVLIAPFTPTLYPILSRESPLWDIAYYFPATAQRQEAMIHELPAKNVNWAIISDTLLDKREDLLFSATHKLVWQYLTENFEPVESACLPKWMKILHRKHPAG